MKKLSRGVMGFVVTATLCAWAARPASASNLLVNGDFSSLTSSSASDASAGSAIQPNYWAATGWTTTGATSGVGASWFYGVHVNGFPSGGNVMEAFHTTDTGSISQSFATVAGTKYYLSYMYNSGDTMPSEFDISITNATSFSPSLPSGPAMLSPTGFTQEVNSFIATSTSSLLTFTMQDLNSNIEVGLVSVDTTNPVIGSGVPLPGSFYLSIPFAAGLIIDFIRRRRAMAKLTV